MTAAAVLVILAGVPGSPRAFAEGDGVRELSWTELIPEAERGQPKPPPAVDHSGVSAMQQPLFGGVVEALDGLRVKLPGFVVPVEMSEDYRLREFFLVPYFGACIHVPPPPPNQIVYGVLEEATEFDSIYDAVWIHGTFKVERVSNAVAQSSYRMEVERIELYEE